MGRDSQIGDPIPESASSFKIMLPLIISWCKVFKWNEFWLSLSLILKYYIFSPVLGLIEYLIKTFPSLSWDSDCLFIYLFFYQLGIKIHCKAVDWTFSSQEKKNTLQLSVGTDVNWTYYGDHFAIYTNIESLCCTFETNVMSVIPQLKSIVGTFLHLLIKIFHFDSSYILKIFLLNIHLSIQIFWYLLTLLPIWNWSSLMSISIM